MEQRYRTGSGLAVFGGVVLVISLFISWFSEEACGEGTCSALKTFSAIDIVLLGLGIAGIVLGLIGLATPARAPSILLSAAGFIAFGLVLAILAEFGDDLDVQFGIYLGLVAAAVMAIGGAIATPGRQAVAAPTVGPGAQPRGAAPAGPGSGGPLASAQQAASMPAPSAGAAAGWYPDPTGEAAQRYWDGSRWTEHTS
jgi:hypothetical protein